jgi:hypothetical protein
MKKRWCSCYELVKGAWSSSMFGKLTKSRFHLCACRDEPGLAPSIRLEVTFLEALPQKDLLWSGRRIALALGNLARLRIGHCYGCPGTTCDGYPGIRGELQHLRRWHAD